MIGTPPVRRRLLGSALRRHRETLGYRLDDAARVLGCDRSKISRIESGQRGIGVTELRTLLTEYGIGEQEQHILADIAHPGGECRWWPRYADSFTSSLLDYVIMEAAASQIMVYQPHLVPDLLQAPQYARAVAAADPALPAGAQNRMAEAMLARQQVILGERRPELAVVLGEGALHQLVGGNEVMAAQLARLAEAASAGPPVSVQVLPFYSGAPAAGGSGPWTLLRFPGTPGLGIVHLAGLAGGICLDSQLDVACYLQAFMQLSASALSPAASVRLLRDMAAQLGGDAPPYAQRQPGNEAP